MIKIVSGWSNPGGSTHAHINLCNLFNNYGLDCEFYGPHDWHLDKCSGKKLAELAIHDNDVIISHYILVKAIKCKKHIYSCHETNLFPIKQLPNLDNINTIHYVSDFQKTWHDHPHNSIVIPNVLSKLKKSPLGTNSAGIIGSIDSHKQTHLSIERALAKNFEKIYIFGGISDFNYFERKIISYFKNWKVSFLNQVNDKQKMYDMIDAVYHSSKRETFNFVKAECLLTGVSYDGLDSAETNAEYWSDEKIIDIWKTILLPQ